MGDFVVPALARLPQCCACASVCAHVRAHLVVFGCVRVFFGHLRVQACDIHQPGQITKAMLVGPVCGWVV